MNQTILLLSLFFCHFLADYTHLSTAWMLSAKRLGTPLFPILCHASVHAILMAITLEVFFYSTIPHYHTETFKWTFVDNLIVFQLITHFLIDVWKGKMNAWFPTLQSPANKWHWIIFGFDQFLHATVIIIMTFQTNNYLDSITH